MPATTSRLGLQYPVASDSPAGHTQMQTLATGVEGALGRIGALQPGVMDSGSFMVTQKGAGANMSVDVASSTGGGAYVKDSTVTTGLGLFYVTPTGSVTNVAIGANASGNPRIDRIVVGLAGAVSVVAGTATVGATLNNLTGAAAVPSSSLLLADVLVANGAASITNSVIRDRRPWARGARVAVVRNANAAAGNDYTNSGGPGSALNAPGGDTTNLAPRIECSGVPVLVRIIGNFQFDAAVSAFYWAPTIDDSTGVNGMAAGGAAPTDSNSLLLGRPATAAVFYPLLGQCVFTPSAGSHKISAYVGAGSTNAWTIKARATCPLIITIEELVRQDAANNTTTSG
jgi:hypothetical protein